MGAKQSKAGGRNAVVKHTVSVNRRTEAVRELDHLTINNLKPRETPYLLWDVRTQGLAVRVEPSGFKSYKMIYRFAGRTRWYNIGPFPKIKLGEARAIAGDITSQVAAGKDPQKEKLEKRGEGTFRELYGTSAEKELAQHQSTEAEAAFFHRRS
jgi:hypothetical protein